MIRIGADSRFMPPATFATRIRRLCDNRFRFAVGCHKVDVAEDQELFNFTGIQPVNPMSSRQREDNVRFERVPDDLFLTSHFN